MRVPDSVDRRRGWPYEADEAANRLGHAFPALRRMVPDMAMTPIRVALIEHARRKLRAEAAQATSIAEWVSLAFLPAHGAVTIRPYQVPSEIARLLALLAAKPPAAILEIGTAWGGTLFLLTRVATPDAIIVSVDLPGGQFGGGYHPTRARLYRSFARDLQRLELVRADSHAQSTRARIQQLLGNRLLDFLLIDGDHSAAGVRADFSQYADFVRPGGTIAFHDIVPGESDRTGGVPELWRELRAQHPGAVEEIVDDWDQRGFGIGLLRA